MSGCAIFMSVRISIISTHNFRHKQTLMMSSVAGAVRIMPAVGLDVPSTSTGVIETESVFTHQCAIELKLL